MKTIYMADRQQWQEHTLDGELEQAAGGGIVGACHREDAPRDGEDKVIDFAAWKAENLVELEELERSSGLGNYEGRELVRRPRRKHTAARVQAELAATLAVVGVMAALILRILLF